MERSIFAVQYFFVNGSKSCKKNSHGIAVFLVIY